MATATESTTVESTPPRTSGAVLPTGAHSVRRPATTFKVRRRGLSPKRQAEFDEWIGRYGLDLDGPPIDSQGLFGRTLPLVLDVGFGHGESTIQLARRQPHLGVIGVEVHTPGVVTVLDAIVRDPLPHVRVVHGDLLRFLDRVAPSTLHGVRVFFPDPWIKARQHHRRLVRADLVAAFVERLEVGGFLHLATDIADYAEQMEHVCADRPDLDGGVIPRPDWRPLTRFERRGVDAARTVTDLWYERL